MRRLSRSMNRAPGGARPASATVVGAIVVGDGTVVKEELTALAPAGTTCLIEAFAYPPSDGPFCSGLHEALMGPAEVLGERGSDAILIACTTALMRCSPVEFAAGIGAAVGLPVISIADALVDLAHARGVRSLAVATPYGERNNRIIRDFFVQAGFEITALEGLDLDSSLDRWRGTAQFMTSSEVARFVDGMSDGGADAICLPSSGIRSATVAAASERQVLSSVAAGLWACLDALSGSSGPSCEQLLRPLASQAAAIPRANLPDR